MFGCVCLFGHVCVCESVFVLKIVYVCACVCLHSFASQTRSEESGQRVWYYLPAYNIMID